MNNDPESMSPHSTAAVEDEREQLRRAASDAACEMGVYAEKHNVDLTGTTIKLTHDDAAKLTITFAKYIEPDHRARFEALANDAAARHPVRPAIEFVYEQPRDDNNA